MSLTEEALPTATNPKSRLVRINDATHRMLDFLSDMRGEPKGLILYRLLRSELKSYQDETAWSPAPPPFVIKQTYVESGCSVLLYNPFLPVPAVLTGKEAVALATAIHDSTEGRSVAGFEIITQEHGHRVQLTPAGKRIHLHVNNANVPMPIMVAKDVAAALDSASVHATDNTVVATVH